MRRLFIVDFDEDGKSMHESVEIRDWENVCSDELFVKLCHIKVGEHTKLTGVTEIMEDISLDELSNIMDKPESRMLSKRYLYIDMEEMVKSISALLKERRRQ